MSPTLEPLVPVAAGLAVVLIGILVFKLHAFLALLLAAAVTAGLTPYEARLKQEMHRRGEVVGLEDKGGGKGRFPLGLPGSHSPSSEVTSLWAERNGRLTEVWSKFDHEWIVRSSNGPFKTVRWTTLPAFLNWPQAKGEPPQFGVFLTPQQEMEAKAAASRGIPKRLTAAFGETVGSIGLLIAFAAIIGKCLLDSGGADRIVRSALRLVGERGAPVAFAGSGFLLGVPVYFDTVFFLLIPLGKALRLRTGRNYLLYVLAIVAGATMAHSLVPPTPGPLLVAEKLGVSVGLMMLVGGGVGLVAVTYGMIHAAVVNRLIDVPLRESPDAPLADLERLAATPDHELPPLWLSLLPIVLPVWLIAQQTAFKVLRDDPPAAVARLLNTLPPRYYGTIDAVGEKNVALAIGAAAALFLLVWQTRRPLRRVRDDVGSALAAGGAIILITAAGGAFGDMIGQTGIASLVRGLPDWGAAGLLAVAFAVTAAIRTAQGSATVAMITAVGLFAGVELPFHPVWLAAAIGCGSKPVSWMTDSGFWVICKMTGMTEAETLKTYTPMTTLMGVAGLLATIAGAELWPGK